MIQLGVTSLYIPNVKIQKFLTFKTTIIVDNTISVTDTMIVPTVSQNTETVNK